MDKEKQSLEYVKTEWRDISQLLKTKQEELKPSALASADPHPLDEIFKQRHTHRDKVLKSITRLMWASFILLASLLGVQSFMRVFFNPTFSLLDGAQLQVLSVSVFGQIVAVVIIISKSLWDDKAYLGLFK